jgi:1-acyl-sn-glycerol-3-phosphate acyltransferase/nucleoside-diphosphate-sugar epimerase
VARIILIGEREGVAEALAGRLRESPAVETCQCVPHLGNRLGRNLNSDYATLFREQAIDTLIYSPLLLAGKYGMADLVDAEAIFQQAARAGIKKVVVLSSAAVYGAQYRNPGLISESRPPSRNAKDQIASRWDELETLAKKSLGGHAKVKLTILRPASVPVRSGKDYFSRLFRNRLAVTLPGYNPSIQVLSLDDLAAAVRCAIEKSEGGTYNVAPDGMVPLRAALRLAHTHRIPIARGLQRLARSVLGRLKLAHPVHQLEYIRYSWTVSNQKIKQELGFTPTRSSAEAVMDFTTAKVGSRKSDEITNREYDEFGMDKDYVARLGRTLFNFLDRYYWRIEVDGLERVPRKGRVVLVGVHRAFMPWDGIMVIDLLLRRLGRCPRFLMHPALIKTPFVSDFMTKIGGVIACQENGDYVLERDEILGVFPDGIKGAFTLYREAYRPGKFVRNDFVKMALRNGAPIVPFVTVGAAESFPILKKIDWRWWKRQTEWPCLPITPTFPLLPVPLPSKWHTQFLAPIHVEDQYGPEAANDPAIVRAISQQVRSKMQEAIEEMLSRRKSIFYGSVFNNQAGGSVFEEEVS